MDKFVQFPRSVHEVKKLHAGFQKAADFPGAFAIIWLMGR